MTNERIDSLRNTPNISQEPAIKAALETEPQRAHLLPTFPIDHQGTKDIESTIETFLVTRSEAMKKHGYERLPTDRLRIFTHNFHHMVFSEVMFPFDHHYFTEPLLSYLDFSYPIRSDHWVELESVMILVRVKMDLQKNGLTPGFLFKYIRGGLFSEAQLEKLEAYYKKNEFAEHHTLSDEMTALVTSFENEVKRSVEVISFSDEEVEAVKLILPIINEFFRTFTGVAQDSVKTIEEYWERVKKMRFVDVINALRDVLTNAESDPKIKEARTLLEHKKQRVFEYFYT